MNRPRIEDTYNHLVECEKPAYIYHYTDFAAFEKIVTNGEMWATHRSFLNDRRDLLYGFEACKQHMSVWKESRVNDTETRLADKAIAGLDKNQKESGPFFYSASFTEEQDGAAQWQIYGQRGQGVSIEFDFQLLEKSLSNERKKGFHVPWFWLNRIEYDHEVQKSHVFKLMDAARDCLAYDPEDCVARELSWFLYLLPNRMFKHRGHLFDHEWKAIPNCSGDDKMKKFYFSRQTVRPYLPMKFDPACICGLIIGSAAPQPFEELKEALSYFLSQHNLTNVEIKRSEVLLTPPAD